MSVVKDFFDPPDPPNPNKVAFAQTTGDINAAVANQLMTPNQVTPYGNMTTSQTGTASWTDPLTGKTWKIPQFTTTQTLTPAQQALLNQEQEFDKRGNQVALNQIGNIAEELSSPINLDNDAIEARLMELGRKRLDPLLAERKAALDVKLRNQGLQPGSDAYDRAMRTTLNAENDAYNQLMLSGRAQSINEILTRRNQPLNEMTAMMGMGQVNQPNFSAPQNPGISGVDLAALISNNYNQRMGANNAMWGALGGAAGAAGGWALGG